MSLFSGDRVTATTAHLVRLVFSISDGTMAACGPRPTDHSDAPTWSAYLGSTDKPGGSTPIPFEAEPLERTHKRTTHSRCRTPPRRSS